MLGAGFDTTAAVLILLVGVIGMICMLFWMIITPPLQYTKKWRLGPYSVVIVGAIVVNLLSAEIIAFPILKEVMYKLFVVIILAARSLGAAL